MKDLKLERDRLTAATRATTVQHRARVLEKLTQLENFVRARGWDDPDYVHDLLNIIDRVIRILGLSEEKHRVEVAVGADVDPEKLVGYGKFVHETRWIPEAAFQPLWDLCRKLSQPPTAETTAAIGPPADSPLWHDDKEGTGTVKHHINRATSKLLQVNSDKTAHRILLARYWSCELFRIGAGWMIIPEEVPLLYETRRSLPFPPELIIKPLSATTRLELLVEE